MDKEWRRGSGKDSILECGRVGGNKDEEFWKRMVEWDIVIMSETWMEKKGWQRMKGRLPREFRR